tara:strand:- start:594 stop:806 length:213 start_codon:yes stop_codon:yes gene_type:complete
MAKKDPGFYTTESGNFVKFGSLRDDLTIIPPNRLTLKWIFNYYLDLKENQTTHILYVLTGLFCILGLLIF